MESLKLFTERLKELMDDKNLTASELANKVNFHRVTISGILNGAHAPSTALLIALAEYFNCSADFLLGIIEFPRETIFKPVKPFSNILRNCLTQNNITEYRLQKDLKLSASLTYRWLRNLAVPSVDSLIALADYFGCSVDYLLGREN
ncbi:MAG: helix-turn-helix transcriptional regulator [Clostridia bacterium]|nr:helix-turn-helix transcriptional regulator [Clostridia bacterium]